MGDKNNRLRPQDYFLFISIIALMVWYAASANPIVNYPSRIRYYIYMLALAVIVLFDIYPVIKNFTTRRRRDERIYLTAITLVKWSILTFIIAAVMLIPFNYYERTVAGERPTETIRCRLDGLVAQTGHGEVYFTLGGRMNIFYCSSPLMYDIYAKKNYNDYLFVITVRPALMGSYVIDDWQIVPSGSATAP